MRYQSFSLFGPWGLTPGPKFTKRGDNLADSEIYHPAKFHRSTQTHARDIPYKISCGRTHTQKKQTSTPVGRTGVYPHMPIAVTTVVKDTLGGQPLDQSFWQGQPLDQSSPKGEMTCWTPRSTTLQYFIALRQPTPEISVTKYPADTQKMTNKQ